MPGSNARALEKARTLPCDAVILDLEDAVAPDAKESARRAVAEAVRAGGFGRREVIVRVNALATAWGADDLAAAAEVAPDAILVPKVDGAADILAAGERLDAAGAPERVGLWAMIETPRAALAPLAVAEAKRERAGRRLACFVAGTNDLAKEMRARAGPGRAALLPALAGLVLAARAEGLDALDGVWNALDDEPGLAAECAQGRELGFDGKTLIHPNQIAAANAAFGPSASEIADAEQVVAAFAAPDAAGQGAVRMGGRMVERLHLAVAERTLAHARAITEAGR
jgi:citrate lyase subunit beta/citryl-CoA lyase